MDDSSPLSELASLSSAGGPHRPVLSLRTPARHSRAERLARGWLLTMGWLNLVFSFIALFAGVFLVTQMPALAYQVFSPLLQILVVATFVGAFIEGLTGITFLVAAGNLGSGAAVFALGMAVVQILFLVAMTGVRIVTLAMFPGLFEHFPRLYVGFPRDAVYIVLYIAVLITVTSARSELRRSRRRWRRYY